MRSAPRPWRCRQHPNPCGRPCRRRTGSARPPERKDDKVFWRTTMYAFTYHRPTTVRQAASLLAKHEEAKLLAGGHTLIPTMKLRLAGPPQIIDMSKIEGLGGIEVKGRSLVIRAMPPHAEDATSPLVQPTIPALAALAGRIGGPAG